MAKARKATPAVEEITKESATPKTETTAKEQVVVVPEGTPVEESSAKIEEEGVVTPPIEDVATEEVEEAAQPVEVEIEAEQILPADEITAAEEIYEDPADQGPDEEGDVSETLTKDESEDITEEEKEKAKREALENEDLLKMQKEQEVKAPENESIYSFSVDKLEEYLSSTKSQDRIMQESVGGNFVSVTDREIYVPLSLFK